MREHPRRRLLALAAAVLFSGCLTYDDELPDYGPLPERGPDASPPPDGAAPRLDAASEPDVGRDRGLPDPRDAAHDMAPTDSGVGDVTPTDRGPRDAAAPDARPNDARPVDRGPCDGQGDSGDRDPCQQGLADGPDGDGDGVPDGCDACPAGDDRVDGDGDGIPDDCDRCPGHDDAVDGDADGVPDGCDACLGHDDALDDDADGIPDGCDACPGVDDHGREVCGAPLGEACFAGILDRYMPEGASVQVRQNGCGQCEWVHCRAGQWFCDDHSPRGEVAVAHPDCPALDPPADEGCDSVLLGRRVREGDALQHPDAGGGCEACSWRLCTNGRWICDGAVSSGRESFPHAACAGAEPAHLRCYSSTLDGLIEDGDRLQSTLVACADHQPCHWFICRDGLVECTDEPARGRDIPHAGCP